MQLLIWVPNYGILQMCDLQLPEFPLANLAILAKADLIKQWWKIPIFLIKGELLCFPPASLALIPHLSLFHNQLAIPEAIWHLPICWMPFLQADKVASVSPSTEKAVGWWGEELCVGKTGDHVLISPSPCFEPNQLMAIMGFQESYTDTNAT